MQYFERNQKHFLLYGNTEYGLRPNQIGAIGAVVAHFSIDSTKPAIISMPTGSGKTTVIVSAPFILASRRVLVIAPSTMLRDQIAEQFETLACIRSVGAVSITKNPKVKVVKGRIKSIEEWDSLREFDVVVATPHTTSPSYDQIPVPPEDIFDLILVDEAHHEPAMTWNNLLSSFPYAKRVLFTATPYRRDQLEINGSIVYNYPTYKAYKIDKIFGEVQYVKVFTEDNQSRDLAIALKVQSVLEQDKLFGYEHYILA
jgi:superfamily II DNA or RNA helicase